MPHISSIAFHDDCFIGLPPETLQEFSDKMKSEVGLSFAIHGVTPADIRKNKIEILLGGGLNRVRMGVQSGSDKILKFYKRPNRAGFVKQAIDTLGEFADRMMPPTYDIIFDNPIETVEDIQATLRLIYDMPRPFALNIFSLGARATSPTQNSAGSSRRWISRWRASTRTIQPSNRRLRISLCTLSRW